MDNSDIQPGDSDVCEICGMASFMLSLENTPLVLKGWLNIPLDNDELGEKLSIPVYVCGRCSEDYTLHFSGATGIDYDGGEITFKEQS